MSVTSTLNHLTDLEKWEYTKPYEITGQVAEGQPRTNFDFTSHEVEIQNARSTSKMQFTLESTGFCWVPHVLTEKLDTDSSITKHIEDMEHFLRDYLQADMVMTFQYQVRKREPDPKDPRVRPPSNFVHVDVSPMGAESRVRFSFPEKANTVLRGRYRLLSLWRPLVSPLHDYPLAVCDASTVEAEDLVESDYVYPNFESESLLVKRSVNHNWYYMSEQTKDELLIITNFDSLTGNCVPHSGFELPPSACPSESFPLRQSLEIKVVVYNK